MIQYSLVTKSTLRAALNTARMASQAQYSLVKAKLRRLRQLVRSAMKSNGLTLIRRTSAGTKAAPARIAKPPAVGFKPIARALNPCSPRRSAMSVMVSERPTPTIVTVAIAETRARMIWRPSRASSCSSCWKLTVNRVLTSGLKYSAMASGFVIIVQIGCRVTTLAVPLSSLSAVVHRPRITVFVCASSPIF